MRLKSIDARSLVGKQTTVRYSAQKTTV